MTEHLLLKWGTLKGWDVESESALNLLKRYHELGHSLGAMQQCDTPEQKQIICDLIDVVDGEIQNDWSGKIMSKDEAKSTFWIIDFIGFFTPKSVLLILKR